MKYEIQANANDTITPHAIFAVNGPMVARTVTLAEAQFIVRACNCHDQLVAALKGFVEYAEACDDDSVELDRARAALAAAEAA
jgi:hypothetical protein